MALQVAYNDYSKEDIKAMNDVIFQYNNLF